MMWEKVAYSCIDGFLIKEYLFQMQCSICKIDWAAWPFPQLLSRRLQNNFLQKVVTGMGVENLKIGPLTIIYGQE